MGVFFVVAVVLLLGARYTAYAVQGIIVIFDTCVVERNVFGHTATAKAWNSLVAVATLAAVASLAATARPDVGVTRAIPHPLTEQQQEKEGKKGKKRRNEEAKKEKKEEEEDKKRETI